MITWSGGQYKLRTCILMYGKYMRQKLDYFISILCNNCQGAIILHDYGMPF